jgi:hypothetical protein
MLHLEPKPKKVKEETKKNNMLVMDLEIQVESSSNVDENIVCTTMQEEVNLGSFHTKEEKDMAKINSISRSKSRRKMWMLYLIPIHMPTS